MACVCLWNWQDLRNNVEYLVRRSPSRLRNARLLLEGGGLLILCVGVMLYCCTVISCPLLWRSSKAHYCSGYGPPFSSYRPTTPDLFIPIPSSRKLARYCLSPIVSFCSVCTSHIFYSWFIYWLSFFFSLMIVNLSKVCFCRIIFENNRLYWRSLQRGVHFKSVS